MADITQSNWSETDTSNTTAPPDGAPEGMNPSSVNDWMRMAMGAIKRWYDWRIPVTTGGTTSAYTVSYSVSPTALADGMTHRVMFNAANTLSGGETTINFNSLGAKNIRKYSGGSWVALAAGDLKANSIHDLSYHSADSTYRIVSSAVAAAQIADTSADNTFSGAQTFNGAVTATSTVALGSSATATTQTALNNSTKVATTAYADSNLIQIVRTVVTSASAGSYTGTYSTTGGSAPTNSGGTALTPFATSFTPKSASSVLEFDIQVKGSSGASDGFILALFNGSTLVDFVPAYRSSTQGVNDSIQMTTWLASPGTSALSFSLRIGSNSGSAWGLNQANSGSGLITQSGITSWLTIKEILPHP